MLSPGDEYLPCCIRIDTLLLLGGNKSTQQRDIGMALELARNLEN